MRMQPTQGDVPIENPQHCRLLRPMPQWWFCGCFFVFVLWPFGVVLDVEFCFETEVNMWTGWFVTRFIVYEVYFSLVLRETIVTCVVP